MDKLKAIKSFVEAATNLSFTAAARRLGIPRGKVSRDIADLERLGEESGLVLRDMIEMPANNRTLVFAKRASL